MEQNNGISADVWFNYPQTGSILKRVRKYQKVHGLFSVNESDAKITGDDEVDYLNCAVDDIQKVKGFGPGMTLYLKDGSKFDFSFDPKVPIGSILRVKDSSIDNYSLFYAFFKDHDLLVNLFGKKV